MTDIIKRMELWGINQQKMEVLDHNSQKLSFLLKNPWWATEVLLENT